MRDMLYFFFLTYLHKSISSGACMNVWFIKDIQLSFAELVREQMKENGKPISNCALLAIYYEIGIHLV